MTRRRRPLWPAVLTASLMLLATEGPARAASPAAPAAEVGIVATGKIGRFDTAIVSVRERCRAGAVVADLVVNVAQPRVSGTRSGTFGAVCDGAWHTVSVEVFSDTGDPFVAGSASVFARFTVLDPDSMDPLPQGTASARVTLLPTAEVKVGQEAHLGRFESVVVPVLYRCQRPWIVSELSVEVGQGATAGSAFRSAGLRCDAAWHHIEVGVGSDTGAPFARGYADITIRLNIQDPIEFDPVEQAVAQARTWVSPAARIVVSSARLLRSGSVSVQVAARCHRPFVVAEFGVSIAQHDGRIAGSAFRQTGLTCDAQWHALDLTVTGRFVSGAAIVDAVLDIQDPVDFDPVDQATDHRTLTLTAPR